jgi:type I restriction enzyme, S subunit
MEDDYTTYSFAELLSNIVDNRGKTCPVDDAGLPLIATNCVKNDTLFPVFKKVRYVNQETYDTWFRGHPEPGDMIFVCKGSPGNVCWTPEPVNFCIAQDMVAIRANQKIVDSKYLFSLLRSPVTQTKILNMHVGTLIPHFKKGDFKNLYFDIPNDKGVQKAIGNIYFRFSERIELNSRMNETLEAMAQALFKSWFVDFDPVIDNALAGGKEIPAELSEKSQARVTLGDKRSPLPEEIRTLFPDEFSYSDELGWIPKGWEVGSLADVCFVKGGYAFKSKDFTTSGYPVIKIKNINNDRTVSATDVQYIPKDIANNVENFWLSPGDLIMAMTGATVGKFGLLVPEMEKTYLLNQRVAKFYPIDAISPKLWFVYCCLCQKNVFDYIVNVAHGSAQPNVSAATIMATTILRPDDEIIRVFNNMFDGNFVKMLSNRETVQTLSKLRDTLLPKLLSGEIRIPDAEKMVEELAL